MQKLFTLAVSGTRTRHPKAIEISLKHTTWNSYRTWKIGIWPIFPCTCPGPCSCSDAVKKTLHKTIQPILPGPGPCPGPRDSQCEYIIRGTPDTSELFQANQFCLNNNCPSICGAMEDNRKRKTRGSATNTKIIKISFYSKKKKFLFCYKTTTINSPQHSPMESNRTAK